MIPTLLRLSWLNLKRDRPAQALTFLLPIIFFSIFASIFSNQRDPTRRVRIALVDEDQTEYSHAFVKAFNAEDSLSVRMMVGPDGAGGLLDRAKAEALIKKGEVPVAVILPKGFGAAPRFFGGGDAIKVPILADVSDPIAPQMVLGLLQKTSFTAAPASMATEGVSMLEKYGGPLTPAQRQSMDYWVSQLKKDTAPGGGGVVASNAGNFGLNAEIVNVMKPAGGDTSIVSFYAAGVGVMFLLFSCAGAGGTLLDEEESGTLGRLMSSRAGIRGVLMGKWAFIAIAGVAQLTIMFIWGALVFHLPLTSHIPGFLVMTLFTAAAASGFGMLLATISRSRAQLSGISTIVILTMSALGGSMFPRFLMSETMQKMGLVTFNAWALDGFIKVFWRDAPIVELWPQVLVLSILAVVFLAGARLFARRWETL